jgi:hypothetical protein
MNLLKVDDKTVINPSRIVYAYETWYPGTSNWVTTVRLLHCDSIAIDGRVDDLLKKIELWEEEP